MTAYVSPLSSAGRKPMGAASLSPHIWCDSGFHQPKVQRGRNSPANVGLDLSLPKPSGPPSKKGRD